MCDCNMHKPPFADPRKNSVRTRLFSPSRLACLLFTATIDRLYNRPIYCHSVVFVATEVHQRNGELQPPPQKHSSILLKKATVIAKYTYK